jgi:phosphatidylglycerol:prolipoprotein diacylglycerol transferase
MRPILFRLPVVHWAIYSYGVMLGISLIVGWYLSLTLAARDGLPRERMASCYVYTAVAAVIGARLLYVLTNLDRFDSLVELLQIREGGLVAYGGFLGGLLASWIYCRVQRIPLLAWADCAVPSLATGLFFTRIGCFLYGCDYGSPSHVPWAVSFPGISPMAPGGSPAYQLQEQRGLLPPGAAHSLPVHPTQIYESLLGLAIFALLMLVRRRRRFSGETFLWFGLSYGVGRFLLEYLRGDDQRGSLWGLSTSQVISLAIIPLCVAAYVWLLRRWKEDPGPTQVWTLGIAAQLEAASASSASVTGGRATGARGGGRPGGPSRPRGKRRR